jgi:hypothetical protein
MRIRRWKSKQDEKPSLELFKEALLTLYLTNKTTVTSSSQIYGLLLYKNEEVKRQVVPFQHSNNLTLYNKRRRFCHGIKETICPRFRAQEEKKGKVVVLFYGRFLKVSTITIVATAIATMIAAVAASMYVIVDVSVVFTWVGSTVGDGSAIVKLVPALER